MNNTIIDNTVTEVKQKKVDDQQHYFDLGKAVAKTEFNKTWFWSGLLLGLQIGIAIMYLFRN